MSTEYQLQSRIPPDPWEDDNDPIETEEGAKQTLDYLRTIHTVYKWRVIRIKRKVMDW